MEDRARVISVANQKGGVGKTTTAVNLAASLAALERRVLLIDLDPQGAVAPSFGVSRQDIKGGMFDVFTRGESVSQFIISVGRVEVGIVPVNVWTGDDEEAYLLAVRPEILSRAIETLRPRYDYIFIDNPPSIGPLVVSSLAASDSLLVPVQCEDMSVRTLGRLMRLQRKVAEQHNPRLSLEGIVLTMVDGRTSMTTRIINTMRESFGNLLFQTMVPRTVDLARITSNGEPLLFTKAMARGAQAYLKLAQEVLVRERWRLAS